MLGYLNTMLFAQSDVRERKGIVCTERFQRKKWSF
jgi:hypothetical protein